jgi:hypothetical protein
VERSYILDQAAGWHDAQHICFPQTFSGKYVFRHRKFKKWVFAVQLLRIIITVKWDGISIVECCLKRDAFKGETPR